GRKGSPSARFRPHPCGRAATRGHGRAARLAPPPPYQRVFPLSPAPRAVVALAVLALSALLIPIEAVALLTVALVAAVVVDARAARRRPEVTRTAPEVMSRGIPAPLKITAT